MAFRVERETFLRDDVAAGEVLELVEVRLGVRDRVDVAHTHPVDEAGVEPAGELAVRFRENARVVHPDGGHVRIGVDATVVKRACGACLFNARVVLCGQELLRVLVVLGLLWILGLQGFRVDRVDRGADLEHRFVCCGVGGHGCRVRGLVDHHRDLALCPLDVEPVGVLGLLAVEQHVPPVGVRARVSDVECARHKVDDDAHVRVVRGC